MTIWGFHLVSLTLTFMSHATLLWLIEYLTEIQGGLSLMEAYQALFTPGHSVTVNHTASDCKEICYDPGTHTKVDRSVANLLLDSKQTGLKLTPVCAHEIYSLNYRSPCLVMTQKFSKLE